MILGIILITVMFLFVVWADRVSQPGYQLRINMKETK